MSGDPADVRPREPAGQVQGGEAPQRDLRRLWDPGAVEHCPDICCGTLYQGCAGATAEEADAVPGAGQLPLTSLLVRRLTCLPSFPIDI